MHLSWNEVLFKSIFHLLEVSLLLEGLDGVKCQLSVKILAICHLSVKFSAFYELSVKWFLIINNETYLFIFDPKFC